MTQDNISEQMKEVCEHKGADKIDAQQMLNEIRGQRN